MVYIYLGLILWIQIFVFVKTKNPVEVPGELEIASMSEDDQVNFRIII